MKGQIILDCVSKMPKTKLNDKYLKQKWRNALQKYCDKEAYDEKNASSAWCKCGYMNYCDYCLGSGLANPCVKAISKYIKKHNLQISYTNFNFENFLEILENLGERNG